MSFIPVIGIDDDNHSISYVTRGNYYSNSEIFMREVLCKPHTDEYKIKIIHFVDLKEDLNFKGLDGEQMCHLLDCVSDIDKLFKENHNKWLLREEVFNFLFYTKEEELYEY